MSGIDDVEMLTVDKQDRIYRMKSGTILAYKGVTHSSNENGVHRLRLEDGTLAIISSEFDSLEIRGIPPNKSCQIGV